MNLSRSGAARQRASDQEVISFLDGRVQELEQALQETGQKLEELEDKHERDGLANLEQVRLGTRFLKSLTARL